MVQGRTANDEWQRIFIAALSVKQIAAVFSGDIQNWSVLGGPDRPISIYARDDKSGTWDTFKNLVLSKRNNLTKKHGGLSQTMSYLI